ncbi:hypothetical protein [Lentzea sp. NPDC051838]|uniref:hypothetical protein n=1 Tax=Lentzea sp. NPDC051838 TaxID=3154849 RepID=UPI0034480941
MNRKSWQFTVALPVVASVLALPFVLSRLPGLGLAQVPLGVLVGAGEFGVAGLLSTVVVSLADRDQVGEHNWLAITRSPLLRPYRAIADRFPLPAVLGLFALVAVATEFFARAVVAGLLGGVPAVVVSIGISCALWTVTAGTWRTARLGLVAGAVTGLVHGILFVHTGQLAPLAAATLTFLALAVL